MSVSPDVKQMHRSYVNFFSHPSSEFDETWLGCVDKRLSPGEKQKSSGYLCENLDEPKVTRERFFGIRLLYEIFSRSRFTLIEGTGLGRGFWILAEDEAGNEKMLRNGVVAWVL